MSTKTEAPDLLHGNLFKQIIVFALPLAISSILQQLFNSIDVAVVGKFATSRDQAAVGCNGALINLFLNLFIGVSVGANVVIANYIGQEKYDKVKDAVHTAIFIALISGVLLIVVGFILARPVLTLMGTPEDTLDLGVLYFRIYFVGMPAIMIYNFGAAILRSTGDTKRPMYCLILAGVINAVLNMILVIVFHMGVEGVGIATVFSNIVSASIILYILCHHKDEMIHLNLSKIKMTRPELKKMLQIGIPSGIQGMIFSLSNVFVQSAINGFGSDAVAGSAIGLYCELFMYFTVTAFNQAVITFISQNFGAKNYDRCKKIYYVGMACSMGITFVMSMCFVFGRGIFASLYTSDPNVAYYAGLRILYIDTLYVILSSYEISSSALRALGYSMTPAVFMIVGICGVRLTWIYTVFQKVKSFEVLLSVYPISWAITGIVVVTTYIIISRRVYSRQD
ncbi:Multi antimicrobial extrusion protein (Na(+)/drug antiporter), MATE family of MDR efflux pump [Lachnospiraceae bacterium TWA4]|nr:Multi antimicrobial extrusion protein (Na(+)/drug antiporter), MATE family of MDR efflux pump [Lachnospiraceae bacterium TWA4]